MIKINLLLLILFFFLGCGSNPSTFELNISEKTIVLPIQKSDANNQNKIIELLKTSWDELKDGSSFEFSYSSVKVIGSDHPSNKGKSEQYKNTLMTSPKRRIYKNIEGQSGLSQLEEGKPEELKMLFGKNIKWPEIEKYLREETLTTENVRIILQTK